MEIENVARLNIFRPTPVYVVTDEAAAKEGGPAAPAEASAAVTMAPANEEEEEDAVDDELPTVDVDARTAKLSMSLLFFSPATNADVRKKMEEETAPGTPPRLRATHPRRRGRREAAGDDGTPAHVASIVACARARCLPAVRGDTNPTLIKPATSLNPRFEVRTPSLRSLVASRRARRHPF